MKKILVVEDQKDTLEFLKNSLSNKGFSVATAENGKDAIREITEFKPDLVILDVILPELDGFEVLQWIRKNSPEVFVILTTVKDEIQDLKQGYNLKADYYITKPYTLEEILKAIELLFSLKE